MATPSANAVLQDQLIGHQVDLIKLEGTVRKDVLKVLKELEGDLIKRLNAIDPTAPKLTAFQQKRLQALLAQTQKIIGSSFGQARKVTNSTLAKLAELETGLANGNLNAAIGTNLGLPALNREIFRAREDHARHGRRPSPLRPCRSGSSPRRIPA